MPELPEVETMVRKLRPVMEGRALRSLTVKDPRLLQNCSTAALAAQARGALIESLRRQGKWIVIHLENPRGSIVIQPIMTGGFWLVPPHRPEHIRLIFLMGESTKKVWFCDSRRLGKLTWYPTRDHLQSAADRAHGPDALTITRAELQSRLARTSRAIKPALLDQHLLAGIGNIYADEILFHARLHPSRPANQLRKPEILRLHHAIRPVLEKAIQAEGSSFDIGYRTVLGLEGGFLSQNAVHRRSTLPCPACGTPIFRTRIPGLLGRSTYLCPSCQTLDAANLTT